jgi:hypothetical protein
VFSSILFLLHLSNSSSSEAPIYLHDSLGLLQIAAREEERRQLFMSDEIPFISFAQICMLIALHCNLVDKVNADNII